MRIGARERYHQRQKTRIQGIGDDDEAQSSTSMTMMEIGQGGSTVTRKGIREDEQDIRVRIEDFYEINTERCDPKAEVWDTEHGDC